MLMQPETFAEQAPRAAAGDRVADAFARDDAELRRRAVRQAVPVGDETAQRQAFALLPHAREIPVLPKSQVAAQTQASGPAWRERLVPLGGSVWGLGGHERRGLNRVRRLRPTRRRLASVALPLLLELRLRNPCCRLRRIFDG